MRRLAATLLVCAILTAPAQASGQIARTTPLLAASAPYLVNSTDDKPDADLGVPACADATGHCTLRAAIMQANFTPGVNTITVPSGTYLLTRPGDDDIAVLGDLDITGDTVIQGAGSTSTIVDGNGAATGDRVFQILSTATDTSLSGLTIRAGRKISMTFDEGGGLLWEGSDNGRLRLNDVVFTDNRARYGGALALKYSLAGDSVDLEDITIRANTAAAGGGGLVADFSSGSSIFAMRDSQVVSNTAFQGGGLQLQGGGSFLSGLQIENSDIYSNTASGFSGGVDNNSGSAAYPLVILHSRLHDNLAYIGGAITNFAQMVISQTALVANTAVSQGGGLYNDNGASVDIEQSTFSANSAQFGGGIFAAHFLVNSSTMTLTNSTLSGNNASRDGAGLYANGGRVQLFNVTLAGNHVVVPFMTSYPGEGGGLYISPTAIITAYSTIMAYNTLRYGFGFPGPNDCYGSIHPYITNLIETTTNCTFVGTTFGNITGQDPLLGPLQFNGGATQTMALLPGSPAIDAGPNPYCTDATGAPLTTDQRGWPRPASPHCDIGAFEYYPPGLWMPLIRR
jgi:CSLREA domain-containing protein